MGSESAVGKPGFGGQMRSLADAYNEHRAALKNYLIRRLQCPETAEDLTQEIWIKVNRERSTGEMIANPRAYLFTMAVNLATDYLRVEARRSELRDAYFHIFVDDTDALTPEHYAIAQDELDCLRRAAAELKPQTREILYHNRFSGLTYQQIAENLGVSPTTVANHIRLALDHFAMAGDQGAGK